MNELPDQIEQEAQLLICRGEDLLDRIHCVAEDILRRISQAMGSQDPQSQEASHQEFKRGA